VVVKVSIIGLIKLNVYNYMLYKLRNLYTDNLIHCKERGFLWRPCILSLCGRGRSRFWTNNSAPWKKNLMTVACDDTLDQTHVVELWPTCWRLCESEFVFCNVFVLSSDFGHCRRSIRHNDHSSATSRSIDQRAVNCLTL
jgi:hypothetical protein